MRDLAEDLQLPFLIRGEGLSDEEIADPSALLLLVAIGTPGDNTRD